MLSTPLFELRQISKFYQQDQPVIDQLSLELQAGEIFGLLGESGAGKSTLLQLAANLIDPDVGEVWLEGEKLPPPSGLLIPGHSDIKIVHQDYQLSATLSVRENIRYALRYYEKNYRDARIEELLELCQLQEVAERITKLLSGGEKQRTAIARALAEDARILLLDEPFANLDLPNNRRLAETIRSSVAKAGAACIFVTHHATDALGLSQRMGILQAGRLVQIGTPQEIYQQPINAYVATLSGEVNILPEKWVEEKLGKELGHSLPEGQVLIRPEKFAIHTEASQSSFGVKGLWSVFEGSRYRVGIELEGQSLLGYSAKNIEAGRNFFLTII